jgi:hypothetical protein
MDISNIKEIFKLIKKGATLESQQKIIELEGIVIDLKKENLSLKQQIELSEKGERCPKCRKGYWNLVESKPHPTFGEVGVLERKYKCSECGFTENQIFDPDAKSK